MSDPAIRRLTGKVPGTSVHDGGSRIPSSVIDRFLEIGDLTGTIADALDEIGIQGAIGSSALQPTIVGARMVGSVVTVRNVPQRSAPYAVARGRASRLAEIEGHNQAQVGDVLVIQGVPATSNMGGISAAIGKRQGELGAIVDGGVRDVAWQRSIGFPIWSTEITPVTGKWRVQTVEINGRVTIQGVIVHAGDLVAADETGVCFVPRDVVEKILARCEEIAVGEAKRLEEVASGMPVADLADRTYVYRYASVNAESESELDSDPTPS